MAVLFLYELKKLLNRKLVWALFALFMAYLVYSNWQTLARGAGGYAQGMRYVYTLYEGRVLTDALQDEAKKAYAEYVAARPGRFENCGSINETDIYAGKDAYCAGVSEAFIRIIGGETLEYCQETVQRAAGRLKSPQEPAGYPMPDAEKKMFEAMVENGFVMPVVHYRAGWEELYSVVSQVPGWLLLFLLVVTLLPVFNREHASRMDGIVLCAGGRRKAALAKMLAAACIAAVSAALFFGVGFLFTAVAFGLDGAALPDSAWHAFSNVSLPTSMIYALSSLAVVLAAAACAALVSLSSALCRQPLLSLLCAAAFIAPQIVLGEVFREGGEWMGASRLCGFIQTYCTALPAELLLAHPVGRFAGLDFAIAAIGLPAVIIALCFFLAPRQFLKRRKA